MSDADTYLTRRELAARWKVSEGHLRNLTSQRRGPTVTRIGGNVRYRLDHVKEHEESDACRGRKSG